MKSKMSSSVFVFATLVILINLITGVLGGCASGFHSCKVIGNHCTTADPKNTCPECICWDAHHGNQTPTVYVDAGCVFVQTGWYPAKCTNYPPKRDSQPYIDIEGLEAELGAVKEHDPELYGQYIDVLASMNHGSIARAISQGVLISQISDGQVQVPTNIPVVSTSTETSTTTLILSIPQTYGAPPLETHTSTIQVSSSTSESVVQSYSTSYSVVVPSQTSTTSNGPVTASSSSIKTLSTSGIPVTLSNYPGQSLTVVPAPVASVRLSSSSVGPTYGSNTTITTPTITSASVTATPSEAGAVTGFGAGGVAAALAAFGAAFALL